jgi:hypothetical protein
MGAYGIIEGQSLHTLYGVSGLLDLVDTRKVLETCKLAIHGSLRGDTSWYLLRVDSILIN